MDASSKAPGILLVTDSRRLVPGAPVSDRIAALERQARRAFAAGVDAVQIREGDLDGGVLFDLVARIASFGRVIVTDRADVAVAAGAAGVHLKADGPDPERVRALLRTSMTLSRAVHAVEEARAFGANPALDWLLAGTAFETASKPGRPALGASGLRTLAQASRRPVIAIGGMNHANAPAAYRAGAHGIAAIGIFLGEISREYVDSLRDRSLE